MVYAMIHSLSPYPYVSYFVPAALYYSTYAITMQAFEFLCTPTESSPALDIRRDIIFVGLGLSCLGTLHALCYANPINQQAFIAFGCICWISSRYQNFLSQTLEQTQQAADDLQKRLFITETALSDRDQLRIELSQAQAQYQELCNTVAELSALLSFFESFRNSLQEIDLRSFAEQKQLLTEQLSSIEKLSQYAQKHFQTSDAQLAEKFAELTSFLSQLNKRDLDKMALLTKIDENVSFIKKEVVIANASLDQLRSREIC